MNPSQSSYSSIAFMPESTNVFSQVADICRFVESGPCRSTYVMLSSATFPCALHNTLKHRHRLTSEALHHDTSAALTVEQLWYHTDEVNAEEYC